MKVQAAEAAGKSQTAGWFVYVAVSLCIVGKDNLSSAAQQKNKDALLTWDTLDILWIMSSVWLVSRILKLIFGNNSRDVLASNETGEID